MPYDSSLDEKIFSKVYETPESRVTVSVYSYNQGVKKLQIGRENANAEGEFRFAKLGRMTKDEVAAILPLIGEALPHL